MKVKRLIVLFLAIIFVLTTVVAFAAGDNYFVIKDKNGVCKIIKATEKTPETIAGPFSVKKEAIKAKRKECPKASSRSSKSSPLPKSSY
ncbi:MAG: hypothetical protein ACP5VS_00110 [Desulfomonilaceae bacterium]